jgi:UDP-N-acetylglucosamine--N-acetylmuramyl-(pentapeptide) pyrophosphoryl-undecaprenol N-acetylglucosamine transferase
MSTAEGINNHAIKNCRYLIMAGGTGGHIFPALAVAKELLSRGAEVNWLGATQGMEQHIVAEENIPLHTITMKGFRGKSLGQKLLAPILLCGSVFQAMRIIRQTRSSVIVGFGGFVAAPGGIAARLLGKKLIVHEQNAVAGSTNRLLNKFAHQTLEAFPKTLPNASHVGNPIRAEIVALTKTALTKATLSKKEPSLSPSLNILIMGGSLGAKAINDAAPSAFVCLLNEIEKTGTPLTINIWHQTGKGKKETVATEYQTLEVSARIDEFVDDVAAAYAWADIIVCRAGALTVSEVAVASVPAIFIPLPSAIDNHQYYNAQWLVENDAACLIEQKLLTAESLSQSLLTLVNNEEKLNYMSEQLAKIALPNATKKVADYCHALCASIIKEVNHAV